MTGLRWNEVDREFDMNGLLFRIVQGKKGPDDRRLDVETRFLPVHMRLGGLLADFFYENEGILYPPDEGFAGGNYYLGYLHQAARQGWQVADDKLQEERRGRRLARVGGPAYRRGHR